MDTSILILATLFFFTAFFYAGAGFGGGSTYLALLVLFGVSYQWVPQLALSCNLLVVSGSTYRFFRAGELSLKRVLPFVIGSIPLAYVGGCIPVSKTVFLILLGLSLAVAGLRLMMMNTSLVFGSCPMKPLRSSDGSTQSRRRMTQRFPRPPKNIIEVYIKHAFIGGGIGFLSGIVGIGGGIFLSPILYFMRWGEGRQIAAAASFFILVNSMSGLVGQWHKMGTVVAEPWMMLLGAAVIGGGYLGNCVALEWISHRRLQQLTGSLVTIASIQVLARVVW